MLGQVQNFLLRKRQAFSNFHLFSEKVSQVSLGSYYLYYFWFTNSRIFQGVPGHNSKFLTTPSIIIM